MRISTEENGEFLEVLFASAARHSLATCGLYAVSHGTFPRPRQDQVVAVVRAIALAASANMPFYQLVCIAAHFNEYVRLPLATRSQVLC